MLCEEACRISFKALENIKGEGVHPEKMLAVLQPVVLKNKSKAMQWVALVQFLSAGK